MGEIDLGESVRRRLGLRLWASDVEVADALLKRIEALEAGHLADRAKESPEAIRLMVREVERMMGRD